MLADNRLYHARHDYPAGCLLRSLGDRTPSRDSKARSVIASIARRGAHSVSYRRSCHARTDLLYAGLPLVDRRADLAVAAPARRRLRTPLLSLGRQSGGIRHAAGRDRLLVRRPLRQRGDALYPRLRRYHPPHQGDAGAGDHRGGQRDGDDLVRRRLRPGGLPGPLAAANPRNGARCGGGRADQRDSDVAPLYAQRWPLEQRHGRSPARDGARTPRTDREPRGAPDPLLQPPTTRASRVSCGCC